MRGYATGHDYKHKLALHTRDVVLDKQGILRLESGAQGRVKVLSGVDSSTWPIRNIWLRKSPVFWALVACARIKRRPSRVVDTLGQLGVWATLFN